SLRNIRLKNLCLHPVQVLDQRGMQDVLTRSASFNSEMLEPFVQCFVELEGLHSLLFFRLLCLVLHRVTIRATVVLEIPIWAAILPSDSPAPEFKYLVAVADDTRSSTDPALQPCALQSCNRPFAQAYAFLFSNRGENGNDSVLKQATGIEILLCKAP